MKRSDLHQSHTHTHTQTDIHIVTHRVLKNVHDCIEYAVCCLNETKQIQQKKRQSVTKIRQLTQNDVLTMVLFDSLGAVRKPHELIKEVRAV
jgi:hypothetical protein